MPDQSPSSPGRSLGRGTSKLREYVKSFLWALLLVFLIRGCLVQTFYIPSGSMENTLAIGDYIMVNKLIYGIRIPFTDQRIFKLRNPKRGDVMVFEFPPDPSKDFIKRVIGLPGDTVAVRAKKVYVNGKLYRTPQAIHRDKGHLLGDDPQCLDENTFPRNEFCRDFMPPIKVPPGEYFVMGDNRDLSYDSRFWGFVPQKDLVGEAMFKYWSWDKKHDRVRWGNIGQAIN
jgi:signal peptidase I